MWEYKIFKTNLGYGIYRQRIIDNMTVVHFLSSKERWGLYKSSAITFYNKDDAVGMLVKMRIKDSKEKDEVLAEIERVVEKKTTRSEL